VIVSKEEDNKAIVGRWFTDFWGKTCDLGIVDELAAPDMLLQYSLHEPRRGREDIKAFMTDFRKAFPDLNFWGAADLIAEGDYVVGRWEGGGTHTGPAFSDFLMGSLPANTGRKMKFTGTTVLKLKDGKILEEIGLDDGVAALQQLGLIRAAESRSPLARRSEKSRNQIRRLHGRRIAVRPGKILTSGIKRRLQQCRQQQMPLLFREVAIITNWLRLIA
jgi:predicted ester cyclase